MVLREDEEKKTKKFAFTDYGKLSKDESKKYFYTAKPIIKEVSKEEFEEFIKNYPRQLERFCSHMNDEIVCYYDKELAPYWLYNKVAKEWYSLYEPYTTYTIVVNYDELYNTRTGNAELFEKQVKERESYYNYRE